MDEQGNVGCGLFARRQATQCGAIWIKSGEAINEMRDGMSERCQKILRYT